MVPITIITVAKMAELPMGYRLKVHGSKLNYFRYWHYSR